MAKDNYRTVPGEKYGAPILRLGTSDETGQFRIVKPEDDLEEEGRQIFLHLQRMFPPRNK